MIEAISNWQITTDYFGTTKWCREEAVRELEKIIEAMKCCGNCKHENPGEERCKMKSKGFQQKKCNWQIKEGEL